MSNIFEDFQTNIYNITRRVIIEGLKKKKNTGSMTEIMGLPSSQSIAIKMGNVLEEAYNKFVDEKAQSIRKELQKQVPHQIDIAFIFGNIVYYFESKANLNLDTEKSKVTIDKVKEIEKKLKELYPSYRVVAKCLSSRYRTGKETKNVKTNIIPLESIYGYKEFFEIFEESLSIEIEQWETIWKEVGEYIINETSS